MRGAKCDEVMREVVDQVASWYARRVWWMTRDELVQEGWVAALEASSFIPDTPDDKVGGYVRSAVSKHLSRYCWQNSSPLGSEECGRDGVVRADVDQRLGDPSPSPEEAYARADAESELSLLRGLLEGHIRNLRAAWRSQPSPGVLDAAIDVLMNGTRPVEAAASRGLDVWSVYRETQPLKTQITGDAVSRGILYQIKHYRSIVNE